MRSSMRRIKRRMPAIILPESKAINYALVLRTNPHGEYSTLLGIVYLTVLVMEVWTKDKPHAFSLCVLLKN